MDILVNALKSEKVPLTLIMLLGLTVWWVHGWAQEEFVGSDDFTELKELIIVHVADMQIVHASQLVRDKELALQISEGTGEPIASIEKLEGQITQAKTYRRCLIREEPNCKHLKPPE